MGQPPIWKQRGWTPEDLDAEIQRIFQDYHARDTFPLWLDLARELGVSSKTLERYRDEGSHDVEEWQPESERGTYCLPVKKAWEWVCACVQRQALTGSKPVGAIAWLNAYMNWRQGVDVTSGGKEVAGWGDRWHDVSERARSRATEQPDGDTNSTTTPAHADFQSHRNSPKH